MNLTIFQKKVPEMKLQYESNGWKHCLEEHKKRDGDGKETCQHDYSSRWSYAIPLEIIYLTPLYNWNPYDIEYAGLRQYMNA